MQNKRSPRRICSRIGLGLFLMIVVWLVSSALLSVALGRFAPWVLSASWGGWLLNNAPLYLLGMPVYLLVLRTIPDGPADTRATGKFGPGRFLLALVFCLGATYLLTIVSTLLQNWVSLLKESSIFEDAGLVNILGGSILINILGGAVTPAIGEEFMLRYMLRRKMRGCPDKTYIVFSALCFAAMHANIGQLFYAFAVGAAFAWIYLRTKRLWIVMLLHFLINLLGLIVLPTYILPWMEQSPQNETILGLAMLFLIVSAVVIFGVSIRRIARGFAPPSEAGWPYKPPRGVFVAPVYQFQQYRQADIPHYAGYVYAPPMPPIQPLQPRVNIAQPPDHYCNQRQSDRMPRPEATAEQGVRLSEYPAALRYTEGNIVEEYYNRQREREAYAASMQQGQAWAEPQNVYVGVQNAPYSYPPPRVEYVGGGQRGVAVPKAPGGLRVCLGNVGMVLYLLLTGLITIAYLVL